MRPPLKPRRKRTKAERDKALAFAELQAKWYAKLKKTGFVDIECGRDLNKANGQTLRGAGPNSHVLWEFTDDAFGPAGTGYDETIGLGDTAKFEYYDRISAYAAGLPSETRRQRKLKLMATMAGQGIDRKTAVKELNMSKRETATLWTQMLEELNLPTTRVYTLPGTNEPEPAPGKVSILSKSEIAKLNYTPPKMIKARTDVK